MHAIFSEIDDSLQAFACMLQKPLTKINFFLTFAEKERKRQVLAKKSVLLDLVRYILKPAIFSSCFSYSANSGKASKLNMGIYLPNQGFTDSQLICSHSQKFEKEDK